MPAGGQIYQVFNFDDDAENLSINSNGTLNYWNGGTSTSSTTAISAGTWTHIAYTRSSSTIKAYINNVEVLSASSSGNYTSNRIFVFGARAAATRGNNCLNGYLSNVRVLKGTALTTFILTSPLTAITNTQLLTSQSNRLIDNSPNNFTLVKGGDVSVQAFSPFGSISEATPLSYSISSVNGSNYVDVASSSNVAFGSGDYTMEWYTYFTVDPSYSPYMWDFRSAGGAGTQYAYFGSATSIQTNYGSVTGLPSVLNTWRHWAITRSGTTWRLFVDGTQVQTGTDSATYTSSGTYRFGLRYATESTSITGCISNLRFIKGQALYTGSFTPSTVPLTKTTVGSTGSGVVGSLTGTVVVLTLNSATIVDNSVTPTTITSSGVIPNKNNPFGYTAQSATSYTPSLHGGSAYLDGTGDYLSTPSSQNSNFGTADFTIECWVYFNSFSNTPFIWQKIASNAGWFLEAGSTILYCGFDISS
jgi:hypothetical protein